MAPNVIAEHVVVGNRSRQAPPSVHWARHLVFQTAPLCLPPRQMMGKRQRLFSEPQRRRGSRSGPCSILFCLTALFSGEALVKHILMFSPPRFGSKSRAPH